MKSYGGPYYDHLKEIRARGSLRAIKGLKEPLGKKPNWSYISYELFNYLYCKEQMAIWRKTVKSKALEVKLRGKMV